MLVSHIEPSGRRCRRGGTVSFEPKSFVAPQRLGSMRVIRNGIVHTQTERGTIEGDVLIEDGKIADVG